MKQVERETQQRAGWATNETEKMPTISRFYGISIRLFYNDHAPPHFHAVYGEHELIVAIAPTSILQGESPGRVRSLVLEWTVSIRAS